MKTTVEVADGLMAEAREIAKRKGWTVKVVLEQSLRDFIEKEKAAAPEKPFKLRVVTAPGKQVDPNMTFAQMLEISERPFPNEEENLLY